VYRVRGSDRFLYGIMRVEDAPPAPGILSAHRYPMSGAVLLGGINPEIVGVPQEVAEAAHVLRPDVTVQFGSKLEVTLAQITHDLLSSPVLTMLSIENDLRIKALRHRFHVSLIEGDITGATRRVTAEIFSIVGSIRHEFTSATLESSLWQAYGERQWR
jgi:hypothetical protein